MTKLDDKDRRLLAALKRNARASLVSLGRDIDLSRSATHDRILRLEEAGIIKGYTIVTNVSGLPATRAFFSIRFASGARNHELGDRISRLEGVCAAHCLSGDIDMLVEAEGNNSEDVAALRETIAEIPGVDDIRTYTILKSAEA